MAIDFGKLAYLSENSQFSYGHEVDLFPNMSLDEAVSSIPVICMESKASLIMDESVSTEHTVEAIMEGASVGVLMEGALANFGEKVKAFFKKLKDMVMSLIAKLRSYIDRLFMDNKKFYNKYKDKVDTAKCSGVKVKAYELANNEPVNGLDAKMKSGEIENVLASNGFIDPSMIATNLSGQAKTELDKIQDQSAEERRSMYLKKITGEDFGGDGKWAANLMKKALGEKKEITYGTGMFDLKTVGEVLTNARDFSDILDTYKAVQKNLDKSEKNLVKATKQYKSDNKEGMKDKDSTASTVVAYCNEYLKQYQEVSAIIGSLQKIRKQYQDIRVRQAKQMMMAMLKASGAKAEKKDEDKAAEGNEE